MNSWLFPPQTREVQLDEKWSFVHTKEQHLQQKEADDEWGDEWDHTAIDAEQRLLLAVVPGKRTAENSEKIVQEVQDRTRGRTDLLLTTDAHAPYATAIEKVYGTEVQQSKSGGDATKRKRVMPRKLCYATVSKKREKGRVVEVLSVLVFGMMCVLSLWLRRSKVSRKVNTSFVERQNLTDRRQNSRKHRKTGGFSKKRSLHRAATYYVSYSYNYCWVVRTLATKNDEGRKVQRTPAMAAGLTDHVWSVREWVTYPAKPC
jgi:hypothetical protein